MIPILDADAWMKRLVEVKDARAEILAFYDHRVGAITRCPACAVAPVDDHLVHRGDGVFETIAFENRGIIGLDAHLRRLQKSAEGLRLRAPCSWSDLRAILIAVAAASGADAGMLRILLGRGPGGFGLDPAECPVTGLYIIAYREARESGFPNGATACRSAVPIKPPVLSRLKTTNYLMNVLMVLEAGERGVDFTFSFDADGLLAEAAIASVAVVDRDGTLGMPEFRNALAGTTALKAAELAKAFMPVEWRGIPESALFEAEEIVVLGTSYGCVSVVRYEGRPVGDGRPGPVAARLGALLQSSLREERVLF